MSRTIPYSSLFSAVPVAPSYKGGNDYQNSNPITILYNIGSSTNVEQQS